MIFISQPPPTIVKRTNHKTGTYTGNGIDNRNVDIGVALSGKNNVYVIVKADFLGSSCALHRTEHGQGDLTMSYEAVVDVADGIQAFTATGFQVGTRLEVNADTVLYRYVAFWEEP